MSEVDRALHRIGLPALFQLAQLWGLPEAETARDLLRLIDLEIAERGEAPADEPPTMH